MENLAGASILLVLGTAYAFVVGVFVLLQRPVSNQQEREKWEVWSYDEARSSEAKEGDAG